MAIRDYDLPTEPLYRPHHRESFEEAQGKHNEIDKGTVLAGALLGVALLIFMAYMLFVGSST